MARLPKLREIPILLRAVALVVAVRLALWMVPFARLRQAVARLAHARSPRETLYSVEQLSWAVRVVSRYVPRASCLTQALVLHILLRREGLPSRIQVGVSKVAGHFEAHAWVESQDRVVIGDSSLQRYTPMMVWD
ncbi:MAG TPA: lasso peptide biosynthesis B2 protein [Terriglobales bacterium]|nr:lasso peptide biosynthesis B2 protein [Terriglobales bacterium]